MPIFETKVKDTIEQAIIAICNCRSLDHLLKFSYFEDDETDEYLYVQTHLSTKPFLKRLAYAIKYVFGFKSRFGAFDENLFTLEEAKDIIEFLENFVREKELKISEKP